MSVIQVKNPKHVIQVKGLRYIRLQRGISIRELARRINYDEKRIRRLEKGESTSKETIKRICEKLDVDESKITNTVLVNAITIQRLERLIKFKKYKRNLIDKVLCLKWTKENMYNFC